MSSPSPLSSDAGHLPILTKAGLRLLAARYLNGEFEARSWGKTQLLDEFWGEEPTDATITPLATTFAPLLAQIICAISAGGPTPAWVLRVVLTPEFLWLGLHQTAFSKFNRKTLPSSPNPSSPLTIRFYRSDGGRQHLTGRHLSGFPACHRGCNHNEPLIR